MTRLSLEWTQEIDRRREGMVALRRDFHRHPELSFEENRTAAIIADRLHAAKLDVRTGLGRTGVVGVLRGDRPGRTIAWRADIDALPLIESLDAPFVSGTRGVMHACGHDGHTAIAITLAEMLAARRAQMAGTAVFIFQPAEEVFGGAEPMIAAGVLESPRVEEVYGLHLTTQTAAGQVDIHPGPSMASADFFDVEVRGQGGHGAYPHLSMDPITAAASILLGMQNLVSREISAHAPAVLTVGQFVGGTKHNIIPASAVLRGSLRTFDEQVRAQIKQRLRDYASHMARAYRTEASLTFQADGCPVVINADKETAFVRGVAAGELGAAALAASPPVMASDDMSLFLKVRPGCYFRVGISPIDGRPHPHHAPEFEMNEDGLPVGLRLGLAVLLNALGA
ncbi:MAG TPA: M20 family metallopeptidase [Candidatus Binatia bacterium]|nr:M20 family metallopeptidase [Candidatus Binatia bacterium]